MGQTLISQVPGWGSWSCLQAVSEEILGSGGSGGAQAGPDLELKVAVHLQLIQETYQLAFKAGGPTQRCQQ